MVGHQPESIEHRFRVFAVLPICIALYFAFVNSVSANNALERYVQAPDSAYSWTRKDSKSSEQFVVTEVQLTSQTSRGGVWQHSLLIVRPAEVRNPDVAFLLIAGSELPESHLHTLKTLATQAGALAAVLSDVPNQPLYDGRVEDALIAHTFAEFLRTGDDTWPLLFPMVKSAVRACDAIAGFAASEYDQTVTRFVLSGASKRGWTTWLTAAVDSRVAAIAPMVFDMLNMKVQTEWSRKVYGHQSERIHDYTDADLIKRIDEPRSVELREWIDPYSHRERFTMPKLILLGTNDPYWTVDAMRHYWDELPEPKLVFQTPNAGHGLGDGSEAIHSLAAFYEMVADSVALPTLRWSVELGQTHAEIHIRSDQPFKEARLWMAQSEDRDFRNDHWEAHPVKRGKQPGSAGVSIVVPPTGYRAFLMEAEFQTPRGHFYKLSTQATVVPSEIRRSVE